MKREMLLGLVAILLAALAEPAMGQDERSQPPTGRMTFTLRGGPPRDPAQEAAGAAAARQAEAEAAAAEAAAEERKAAEQARRLSQEALGQRDLPLRNFGALTGPLSPTVPTRMRR